MCHILGLTPYDNDGSLDNIQHILADDKDVCHFTLTRMLELQDGFMKWTILTILYISKCPTFIIKLHGNVTFHIVSVSIKHSASTM